MFLHSVAFDSPLGGCACEPGYGICSRTLGTSHSKSDHDIKCIFVHPRDAYFGLKSMATTFKRQFAGAAAGDDVEISGWEARHAMQLLAEDNPAVLGLLLSPIIFLGEEWRARLEDMASKLFSRQRLMYHWYNHGRKNFQSYIKSSEEPLRKRYVHVLRRGFLGGVLESENTCLGVADLDQKFVDVGKLTVYWIALAHVIVACSEA
ncbi:unnamed protein product [Effrenium voratum]|nr:unnamed protein product [Effrenium voratum]